MFQNPPIILFTWWSYWAPVIVRGTAMGISCPYSSSSSSHTYTHNTHNHKHTVTSTNTHKDTHKRTRTRTRTRTCICTCACICLCVCKCICICICKWRAWNSNVKQKVWNVTAFEQQMWIYIIFFAKKSSQHKTAQRMTACRSVSHSSFSPSLCSFFSHTLLSSVPRQKKNQNYFRPSHHYGYFPEFGGLSRSPGYFRLELEVEIENPGW